MQRLNNILGIYRNSLLLMSEEKDPTVDTKGFGNTMTILAWVAVLFLVSLLFEDALITQFNPNQDPETRSVNGNQTVVLKRNKFGHYVASGKINGKEVVFLVDTGATNVSVPASISADLGLVAGASARSQTANGTVTVYRTQIAELQLGNIRITNVRGNINPGMAGPEILLGMSVLKQLEFTQRGDTLILKPL